MRSARYSIRPARNSRSIVPPSMVVSRERDLGSCGARTARGSRPRETTIEGGTIDLEFLAGLIEYLAERIGNTLRAAGRQARSVALRLRYTDFYSVNRSAKLAPPTT